MHFNYKNLQYNVCLNIYLQVSYFILASKSRWILRTEEFGERRWSGGTFGLAGSIFAGMQYLHFYPPFAFWLALRTGWQKYYETRNTTQRCNTVKCLMDVQISLYYLILLLCIATARIPFVNFALKQSIDLIKAKKNKPENTSARKWYSNFFSCFRHVAEKDTKYLYYPSKAL